MQFSQCNLVDLNDLFIEVYFGGSIDENSSLV